MKISLNKIKKLVPEAGKIDENELIKLIGSRLVEVEEKIDLREKYKGIKIAKVVECEPIEGTHLHRCIIEAPEQVQVVCGAPNVHTDMLAVWLPEGTIVPETYGTDEPFELGVRKMRGFESHGMLAGLDEIDLGDDHSGIVEIDPAMAKPGDFLADVFDLNDTVLDIENKSLTHRPDTFGYIGFAREVAGILGVKFAEPSASCEGDFSDTSDNTTIQIASSVLCPRYSCAVLDLSDPLAKDQYLTETAVFLAKSGMRTISKIVDVTNVLMLMTGQPLHAFDYDKFVKVGDTETPTIIVRAAKKGEKLTLLDGKEIECIEQDILITSNDVPVALAGAMGGENTEIDENTKKIILESATFSLYNLRKTQMAHGIFSEAITRFTKGQPAANTMPVLAQAISQIGGKLESISDAYPGKKPQEVIELTLADINGLLGTDYDVETVVNTLENVGVTVKAAIVGGTEPGKASSSAEKSVATDFSDTSDNYCFTVTPPVFRTDLHIKEDIIEEVGRLLGYDNIPKSYPLRPFIGAKRSDLLNLKTKIRNILSDKLNAHELLTYSFVHKDLQEKVGEDPSDSYEIVNSISPDLQVFRQSLLPSLLDKAAMNLKAGYKDFTIYEMNPVTKRSLGLTDENVPKMQNHLAVLTTGDYYKAKAIFEVMFRELGIANDAFEGPTAIKNSVLKRFKIDREISAFELDLDELLQAPKCTRRTKTFSRFPSVERDLTVKTDQPYAKVEQTLNETLNSVENLTFSVAPTSVYKAEKTDTTTNFSFHIKFGSLEKTLENSEISDIMGNIEQNIKNLGGEII